MTEPVLLTLEQVAEYLQVPIRTVKEWRYQGKGPRFIRVGRHLRCDPDDLAQWIKDQKAEQEKAAAS
jgi:excisionase family DNA binding protein